MVIHFYSDHKCIGNNLLKTSTYFYINSWNNHKRILKLTQTNDVFTKSSESDKKHHRKFCQWISKLLSWKNWKVKSWLQVTEQIFAIDLPQITQPLLSIILCLIFCQSNFFSFLQFLLQKSLITNLSLVWFFFSGWYWLVLFLKMLIFIKIINIFLEFVKNGK